MPPACETAKASGARGVSLVGPLAMSGLRARGHAVSSERVENRLRTSRPYSVPDEAGDPFFRCKESCYSHGTLNLLASLAFLPVSVWGST